MPSQRRPTSTGRSQACWATWRIGTAGCSSFAEKIDRGEPWVPGDAEPEGDWLNDSTRPIIHAIAPRAAAELAVRIADETDARVAALPLNRMAPLDPESPIYPVRGDHRGEHLDELERALRTTS